VNELLGLGADEHVPHEQGMVGTCAHDTDVDPVALVPSGKTIDDVDTIPCVQIVHGTFSVNAPNLPDVIST